MAQSNLFASFNTSAQPATNASQPAPASGGLFSAPSSGPGLFGTSATAQQNPVGTSLFGFSKPEDKKTQPAGLFASANLFSTSTSAQPGQGLPQGITAPPAKTEAPRPANIMFGATTQSNLTGLTLSQGTSTGASQPQGTLAGSTTAPQNIFGQPPAQLTTQPGTQPTSQPAAAPRPQGGFFGQTTTSTSTGLFGQTTTTQPIGLSASTSVSQPVPSSQARPIIAPITSAPSSQGLFTSLSTSATTSAPGGLLSGPTGIAAPASTGLFTSTSTSQAAAPNLFQGGGLSAKPEEKKTEEKKNEYVPLQSLEEMKATALATKSLDDILNKWRGTLISLSSDFKQTAYEVKEREISLYQTIEQIKTVLQMNENINKEFEQQKQQLETISKEQEYLNKCLNSMTAELEPYLDRGSNLMPADENVPGMRTNYSSGREEIFHKSKNINGQLNSIETGINEITDTLNETKGLESGERREISGIETVFNTYYDTIKWIEASTKENKSKLEAIESTYGILKY